MNILFVAYESDARLLSVLARRFQEDGHQVLLAQGDVYHLLNENKISEFVQRQNITSVNYKNEYERLYDSDWSVNWEYLRKFEEAYCKSKNVQQLMMTDQILARHHHFRFPYYTPFKSKNFRYYWLECQLRWCENIYDDFQPDLIVTIGRNYLVKNVFAQISASTDVLMLTAVRSRVGKQWHVVRNFGYGTSDRIRRFLDAGHGSDELDQAHTYVQKFRRAESDGGLYNAVAQQRVKQSQLYTPKEVLRWLRNKLRKNINRIRSGKKKRYRSLWKGNYFDSHELRTALFRIRIAWNRLRYIYGNTFDESIPKRPFVYLPLHTLPESSTLTLSTEYYERDLVRYIAKELPAHFVLAVKENPNMVGIRPYSYYEDLKQIPNVRLIDPAVPSKQLIRGSRGVTGVSGTALLEAAVLEKPTHCFGHPEFEAVLDYHGHGGFAPFVNACLEARGPRNPDRVLAYVQYVLQHGREIEGDAGKWSPSEGQIGILEEMIRANVEGVSGSTSKKRSSKVIQALRE
jgi:hypothetical protein